MAKVPTLRKGLTVDALLKGTWMAVDGQYAGEYELTELTDRLLRDALQGLIDYANAGGRVHRRVVSSTLCNIANKLRFAKDHICQGIGADKFTPTILDELANV